MESVSIPKRRKMEEVVSPDSKANVELPSKRPLFFEFPQFETEPVRVIEQTTMKSHLTDSSTNSPFGSQTVHVICDDMPDEDWELVG